MQPTPLTPPAGPGGYREALERARRADGRPQPISGPQVVVWGEQNAADNLVPVGSGPVRALRHLSRLRLAIAGQFLGLFACVLAVVAFQRFQPQVALGLVVAMTLAGGLAASRRVPLALWWTLGIVIGGALGHWS